MELLKVEICSGIQTHTEKINDVIKSRPADKFPDPFLSALTLDCIGRGKDINDGGAEFKAFHGICFMGLATIADSLAALKKLVFEEKSIDFNELMKALAADFAGNEPLRKQLLNRAPKYGNGDDYVDSIAAWLVDFTAEESLKHSMVNGGRFVCGMAANVANIPSGKLVGATPDGRQAGQPLSDAASPHFGRDRKGPTAFIESIGKPDFQHVLTGSVVNMKFDPELYAGKNGRDRFAAFTKAFVRQRIQQMQFNFTGNKVLREAQKNPELYENLVVRVSGFSAYFISLSKEVQEDVIRRRAHK